VVATDDDGRADAATRFPDARLELGSVKAERGVLSMTGPVSMSGSSGFVKRFI